MGWFNRISPISYAERGRRIDELEKNLQKLTGDLERLNKALDKINNEITACAPMIDFDTMRVFSIERLVYNDKPATIIGHYMYEPVIENGVVVSEREKTKEWTLYCNNERHEELVNQFKEWKAKQNG